ncbi:MAG: cytochrome c [Pseudomonadota bacterium]
MIAKACAPLVTVAVILGSASFIAAPALAGDASAGKQKSRACRTCHGLDGIAKIPIAPHIAGENEIYLATQLKAFRSGKRENEIMSVIAKDLSDEDIADLSAWYASITITVSLPE